MKRHILALVISAAVFLCALAAFGLWKHWKNQRDTRARRDLLVNAQKALNDHKFDQVFQLVAQVPEGTPEYVDARKMKQRTEEAEQDVLLKMLDDAERAAREGKIPGVAELTDKGRELALVLAYEQLVGHPIDDAGKVRVERIAKERNLEVGIAARRDLAARWEASSISHGVSLTYSVSGDNATILVLQSYKFADAEILGDVSRNHPSGDTVLCREGFTAVYFEIPGVSQPEKTTTLNCPENNN